MSCILVLLIILLDQLAKFMAVKYLKEIHEIPIIQNVFHLTYVENKGAAFGMLQGQKIFFVLMTIITISIILYYLYNNKDLNIGMKIGLCLITGGAIGNLIDRIRFGFVVDFLDFRIWPVFNIADSAIVVGGILVSYFILKYDIVK